MQKWEYLQLKIRTIRTQNGDFGYGYIAEYYHPEQRVIKADIQKRHYSRFYVQILTEFGSSGWELVSERHEREGPIQTSGNISATTIAYEGVPGLFEVDHPLVEASEASLQSEQVLNFASVRCVFKRPLAG